MPQKIQRVPASLLETLGIKSLGVNPDSLSDMVSPTVELLELYLADRVEVVRVQNTGASVAGDEAVLNVGVGEAWAMFELSTTVKNPTAVGDILNARLGYSAQPAAASGQVALATTPRHVATTTALDEGTAAAVLFPRPRLFLPGTEFSSQLQEAVGGANTVRIEIRACFARLRH